MSLKLFRAYLRLIGPKNHGVRVSSWFFAFDAHGLRAFHRKSRGY